MKSSVFLLIVLFVLPLEAADPLNVFIRAGKKTHGPGAHDHPRFLADWTKLLKEQLKKADVVVFYAANAGSMNPEQRAAMDRLQKRGGGLVFIHDAVCGNDAHWFKNFTGGAWEHRHSRFFEGHFDVSYAENDHPVTKGAGFC